MEEVLPWHHLTSIQQYSLLVLVKATIDIPDELYRKVKAKSALEGRPVRQVVVELFRGWLGEPAPAAEKKQAADGQRPAWFAGLRGYAANAGGRHDMASVRRSIATGRAAGDEGDHPG